MVIAPTIKSSNFSFVVFLAQSFVFLPLSYQACSELKVPFSEAWAIVNLGAFIDYPVNLSRGNNEHFYEPRKLTDTGIENRPVCTRC